mmetsp:Transcript_24319/g.39725  ORF Transcript_24319/g.39725 Transcript_24319/m.39725 type:complete len:84 (+) Transcript_24319:1459-1710(+)
MTEARCDGCKIDAILFYLIEVGQSLMISPTSCVFINSRKGPSLVVRSSKVPSWTIIPSFITAILVACRMVLNLCAIEMIVLPL